MFDFRQAADNSRRRKKQSGLPGLPKKNSCFEKAEICVPILYKNKPVGVIGIIAFDDEQKQKIIFNGEIYMNFIQKMASLLEAKYSEIQMGKENQRLSLRLMSILNTIDERLIVYNGRGEVLHRNAALDRLFKEMAVGHMRLRCGGGYRGERRRGVSSGRDRRTNAVICKKHGGFNFGNNLQWRQGRMCVQTGPGVGMGRRSCALILKWSRRRCKRWDSGAGFQTAYQEPGICLQSGDDSNG
ncbi:MAG: sigma-54 dependent transcriptional regulator, acetoin dehydrogenase operon transcriptional [Thermoanaerobacteraceae bacterium]|nr:sigma-54 dependent transcriptional regulator, acetoin dehydrogenase operon transcriptional [Thermoanaerobacteraceae bacterium]